MTKTHYEVLGINKNASESEIKKAYRGKVKTTHPDVNKTSNAADEFKKVQQAYEVLSDNTKKKAYDNTLLKEESVRQPYESRTQERSTSSNNSQGHHKTTTHTYNHVQASSSNTISHNISSGVYNVDDVTINGNVSGGVINCDDITIKGNVSGGVINGDNVVIHGNMSGGVINCDNIKIHGNRTGGIVNGEMGNSNSHGSYSSQTIHSSGGRTVVNGKAYSGSVTIINGVVYPS
jgi:hypothetical protein